MLDKSVIDEEYLKFQRKLEIELQKQYRIRVIVKCVAKYFDSSTKRVKGPATNRHTVYMKYMVVYIASAIYGIEFSIISKQLGYKHNGSGNLTHITHAMKEKARSNSRIFSDIENIRKELVRLLNG